MEHLQKELEESKTEALKSKKEQEMLIKTKDKEIQTLHDEVSKTLNGKLANNIDEKIADHEGNYEGQVTTLISEHEVEGLKNKNEEAMKHLKDLRSKVKDLKGMWKIHLQRSGGHLELKQTTSAPKKLFNSLLEGASEVGRLEEELISSRLREVETVAELQEWKTKASDLDNQTKTSRNQLSRQ